MERPTEARQAHAHPLHIAAPCPHCGGETRWGLLQRLNACPYCDSALFWPQEGGIPTSLVAEDRLGDPASLLDAVLTLDALAQQAGLLGAARRARAENDILALYDLDEADVATLAEIKGRRRHLFALRQDHALLAPYLLVSATLAYHALGRTRPSERKTFENLFFEAEEAVPAYPPPWNFRDGGLWTSQGRLRPMTEEALCRDPLLAPAPGEPAVGKALRRWSANREMLNRDMTPVAFTSEAFLMRRWWLFRPFHFAEFETPEGLRWFLLDGQFGTVAGYPTAEEIARLLRGQWKRLPPSDFRPSSIRVLPFRCPGCGWDLRASTRAEAQFCGNCGRILRPDGEGFHEVPCSIADPPWTARSRRLPGRRAYLPFWRLEGTFTIEGRPGRSPRELVLEVLPEMGASLPADWGPALFVPAFDAIAWQKYDAFAFETAASLTASVDGLGEGPLRAPTGPGAGDGLLVPVLPPEPFAAILPRLLPGLLPSAAQRFLNPRALERLEGAAFAQSSARLVFVPVPLSEQEPRLLLGPGAEVPWKPLRDGVAPPGLHRSAKHWIAGAPVERPRFGPSPPKPRERRLG